MNVLYQAYDTSVDFKTFIDISEVMHEKTLNASNLKHSKLKNLTSQLVIDSLMTDRELGMLMLKKYQETWVTVTKSSIVDSFKSIQEYIEYQKLNIGMQ